MGYPDLTFRSELDPTTRKELELYSSQLAGFLSSAGFGSDGQFNVNLQSAAVLNPVGALVAIAHDSVPDGWLLCDGRDVSRTTYAALWQKIGTIWGAGNGSSTFNLPNLRKRMLLGKLYDSAVSTAFDVVGETGGDFDHLHATGAGGAHTHTLSGSTGAGTSHSHGITPTMGNDNAGGGGGSYVANVTTTDAESSHTHPVGSLAAANESTHTHGNTGTGNPPYAVINWIIKT